MMKFDDCFYVIKMWFLFAKFIGHHSVIEMGEVRFENNILG